MPLQEMIAAAQSRLDEAKGKDDEAAKFKAEGGLSALKSAESAGYTKTQDELNTLAGIARKEGKEAGKKEARSEFLQSIGVSDEENEEEVVRAVKEWRDGQKTEADRLKGERDNLTQANEAERKRADDLEAKLKRRDRKDAIVSALSEAGYTGKTSHAIGAIDADHSEKVKEAGGGFDATDAVKALSEDEFPGFGAEGKPGPPPVQDQKPGEKNSQAYQPQYSVPGR